MIRIATLASALAMVFAACGGSNTITNGDSPAATADGGVAGQVDFDPEPPGQAMVSVDNREFTFDTPGPAPCTIVQDQITFSFLIGENEVTFAGGANLYDDGWLGSIRLRLLDSDGKPVSYSPDQDHLENGIIIDGDSMFYSGPMLMQPPNDGSAPPPEPVGNGTMSVSC